MLEALLVAVGSGLGGLARWGLGVALSSWLGSAFPWATLAVNVIGCFVLGALVTLLTFGDRSVLGWQLSDEQREQIRLALGVGFCGGFTTFSTFGVESVKLWEQPRESAAVAYVLLSVALGLLAVRAGMAVARAF